MKQRTTIRKIKTIRKKISGAAAVLLLSATTFAQTGGVHVGLFYPISNHGTAAKAYTNSFSLHAFAGVSKAEKAFTLSGFTNVITEDATGFQLAGFSNHIGHAASGVQVAGFANTYGSGSGLQLAGFTNVAAGDVNGVQLSGFFNKAGQANGSQWSGFANVAKDVNGMQLSGFLNKARRVKGVQLSGFINIAESSDYPIGLINLVKNGEKTIGVSVDETQNALVSFRSGGRVLYGIVGVGYNFKNGKEVYSTEAGFGAHLFSAGAFRLNTEAVVTTLTAFDGDGNYLKSSLRLLPSFRPFARLELFAGPTLNYARTNTAEGKALSPGSLWQETKNDYLRVLYWGAVGGIQYHL